MRLRPFGGEWTTIHMKRGDVLIFRGDVCHYGMGYDHVNFRVHFYIDSPVIPRVPNRTAGPMQRFCRGLVGGRDIIGVVVV